MSSPQSFAYQREFFEKDFDVFIPSFKGFGDNKGMDYPYSLDDYVSELKEYFDKNRIVYPHVIAHSFGARVILKALYSQPKLVDKLVLTGAAGLKPKATLKKRIKKLSFRVLKRLVKKERLRRFYSKDYLALDPVMKESFKKIIAENLDYVLPSIENETLLAFGDKDRETPLYMAKRFNEGIKGSKLFVIKDAGHFCFIDKPHKFNLEVREFLLSK